MEKIDCYRKIPRRRGNHITGGHTGSSRSVGRQEERGGNESESLYCGFCGKEQARQGNRA